MAALVLVDRVRLHQAYAVVAGVVERGASSRCWSPRPRNSFATYVHTIDQTCWSSTGFMTGDGSA